MNPSPPLRSPSAPAWLRWAFVFAVLGFVWWRFSENTADNDLWGHVLYGQRMVHLGGLETTETLSWTAAGLPWINHEVLAEVVMGWVHRVGGGTGLWIYMMLVAGTTLGLAWSAGAGPDRTRRLIALALLAVSTNFIAVGYSVRPQLLTYLFAVILLLILRRLLAGRILPWALAPPVLLAVWANTHGGYLAGWLVVMVAVTSECAGASFPAWLRRFRCEPLGFNRLVLVNVALGTTLALSANPWSWKLVLWTIETIRLPRPNILEWHPMPFAAGSSTFFFVLALGAVAWGFSREKRRLWEMAVWLMFAVMAVKQQRHAPLFGLASLIFLPLHLQDLLARIATHTASLRTVTHRRAVALVAALALVAGGGWCLRISRSGIRQYPFRMEVSRSLFPVAAIEYMKAHHLTGNTVTFFDWGQQMLWELPDNPVSFDGRLDTVYPREVMDAHWRFYAGGDPGPALPLNQARYALLPTSSRGVEYLLNREWTVAYYDPIAAVLVHPGAGRSGTGITEVGGNAALAGSVPFPDAVPVLATRVSRAAP